MLFRSGLEQGAALDGRRAAVHLLDQTAFLEELQVAANGHVRNTECANEIGDANGALLAYALKDQRLTLPGQGGAPGTRLKDSYLLRHRVP